MENMYIKHTQLTRWPEVEVEKKLKGLIDLVLVRKDGKIGAWCEDNAFHIL